MLNRIEGTVFDRSGGGGTAEPTLARNSVFGTGMWPLAPSAPDQSTCTSPAVARTARTGPGTAGRSPAQRPEEIRPGGDRLGSQGLRRPAGGHFGDALQVVVEGHLVDGPDPASEPADLQQPPVFPHPVERHGGPVRP